MEDYDDDDDEYFWLLEDPVAEADDLAQNTMPSPVWLDYDSDKEAGETFTDLEYYSDDYHDHASEAAIRESVDEEKAKLESRKKRKSVSQHYEKVKRRRVNHTDAIPEPSLGEMLDSSLTETSASSAVVRWLKDSTFTTLPLPLLADDEGDKVALLKDWRDRFKIHHRDDTKNMEIQSEDYEVPVMKGGLLVIESGNQVDGSKATGDSVTGVEIEHNHTDSISHTNPEATSHGGRTMSTGAVISERDPHPTVSGKAGTAVNGTKSRKRHAEVDDESETGEVKRKATVIADRQPDARIVSLSSKSVSRKRRGDNPAEPAEQTGTALRSQEAIQHNLQHDPKMKASVTAKKSEKLLEAGKENDGVSQRSAAKRGNRAKRDS
ncbi:hypothetical protein MMC27_006410 [Xylographa pallens]|nr:hypothetical protein [Xylographa pallens]